MILVMYIAAGQSKFWFLLLINLIMTPIPRLNLESEF